MVEVVRRSFCVKYFTVIILSYFHNNYTFRREKQFRPTDEWCKFTVEKRVMNNINRAADACCTLILRMPTSEYRYTRTVSIRDRDGQPVDRDTFSHLLILAFT